jgi:large subunit ribosomal protein L20
MPRVTNAVASRKRRKRVLKRARGFRGGRGKLIRQAYNAVDRAMAMAYSGRKQKKRQYRAMWVARINAACRSQEINYSDFMHGLKLANVELNRKVLSNMAIEDPDSFTALVETARKALAAA